MNVKYDAVAWNSIGFNDLKVNNVIKYAKEGTYAWENCKEILIFCINLFLYSIKITLRKILSLAKIIVINVTLVIYSNKCNFY